MPTIESIAIRCLVSRPSKMAIRVLRTADDFRRLFAEDRKSRACMIASFGREANKRRGLSFLRSQISCQEKSAESEYFSSVLTSLQDSSRRSAVKNTRHGFGLSLEKSLGGGFHRTQGVIELKL